MVLFILKKHQFTSLFIFMQNNSSSWSEVSSPCECFVFNFQKEKKTVSKQKNEKERKKYSDQFRNSIYSFIHDVEMFDSTIVNVITACERYKFQKRRFYDVINVLESIGCCHKLKSDSIQWLGLSNIPLYLHSLQKRFKVHILDTKVEDIFKSDTSIIISQLTQLFILCFLVFHIQTINIKHVAHFLSRHNHRYKTTLCKLYQITHILEAAEILKHTSKPCIIYIDSKYYMIIKGCENNTRSNDSNPFSIANLLNDHGPEKFQNEVLKRKNEFYSHLQQFQVSNNILYQ